MAELYINSNGVLRQKIYWAGKPVDTDNNVSVAVYDITEDPAIIPALSPTTLLGTYTATNLETDNGNYELVLPFNTTSRNRKLKLIWSYTVNGEAGQQTTFVDVVTPYVNISEAIDALNFGVDPSDPDYKSYEELMLAEKYARKLIENYTNDLFYLYDDVQIVYGAGDDSLSTLYKVNQIHELYANDILLLDNPNNINNTGYSIVPGSTGYGIKIDRGSSIARDNTVYLANGMVSPTVYDMGFQGFFQKGVAYRIQGKFGWDYVPDEVGIATVELMKDFFNKDTQWKHKYVKNIQTFDWNFEFDPQVYSGTGNFFVDSILANYVIKQMLVI
jgi:hypothetical protein